MTEPTYTLSEAQKFLHEQECARFGHAYNVVFDGANRPQIVLCDRCGESWSIVQPTAEEVGEQSRETDLSDS